jgi:hypothetical protein
MFPTFILIFLLFNLTTTLSFNSTLNESVNEVHEKEKLINIIKYGEFVNKKYAFKDDPISPNTSISTLVYYYLYNFLVSSNIGILNKYLKNDKNCYNSYIDIFLKDSKCYGMFSNSGKYINDIGNEQLCRKRNLTYLFLSFQIENYTNLNEKYSPVLNFTQQKYFFFGLCVFSNCDKLWENVFDEKENQQLYDFMKRNLTLSIHSVKLYNSGESIKNEKSNMFVVTLVILILYIFLRITISLVGKFIYHHDFSQFTTETQLKKTDNLDEKEGDRVNSGQFKNRRGAKKRLFYKIYKVFSIFSAFKYIFGKSKKDYYMKNDTQFLCGTKFIFCYLYTFNHVFYTLINYPHNPNGDQQFLSSLWVNFLKLTSFSLEALICIDGILISFKLMNFLKKYKNFSLKAFLFFSMSLLYQIITFYVIFFLFYLKVENISNVFGNTNNFQFLYNNYFQNRLCYNDPLKTLIPFYYQYYSVHMDKNEMSECFRPFFLIYSQFFCMIVSLTIFYFCFKLKSRFFEAFVLVTCSLITLSIFLYYKEMKFGDQYNLRYMLGEVSSVKQPHLIFPSYFLGNLGGVAYFYYCDIISADPMIENYRYLPFKFTYWLIKSYDQLKVVLKFLISLAMVMIIFGLCFNFYMFLLINRSNDKPFSVPFNFLEKFLFMYERKIFNICLMILLLSLVGFKNNFIRHLLSFNIFISFDKFSMCFLQWVDGLAYLLFGLAKFNLFMNIYNLFMLSMGLFIFLYALSTFMVILLEVPLRIIMKNYLRKKLLHNIE